MGLGVPGEQLVGQLDPFQPSGWCRHGLGIQGEEIPTGRQDVGVTPAGCPRRSRRHESAVQSRHDRLDLVPGGVQTRHEVGDDPGEGLDDIPAFGAELFETHLDRQVSGFVGVEASAVVTGDDRGQQVDTLLVGSFHDPASGQAIRQVGGDGDRLASLRADLVEARPPGVQHRFPQGRHVAVGLTGQLGDVLHLGRGGVVLACDELSEHVQTVGDLAVLQLEQVVMDLVEQLDGVDVDVLGGQPQISVQTGLHHGAPHLFGDETGALRAL